MARRKPKELPETDPLDLTPAAPEGAATTTAEPQPEPEPQVDVRMRGGAEAVAQRLSRRKHEPASQVQQAEAVEGGEKKKFLQALKNPRYTFRVKRIYPEDFGGIATNVEVWSSELPLSYQEITERVAQKYQGGKYRVAIFTQDNELVAADTFKIDGDPAVPEMEASEAERARIFMEGQPKDHSTITEEGLDRRARVSAKLLEVEALEAQLEEARNRREKPKADGSVVRDTRVDDLERRLTEAKHQAELEARDRKHAEEMRELKALIAQNAKPARESDSMTILLEQMRADRKASDDRFNAMMKQMQDEKMLALLDEVKAIKNKPNQQSSSLLDQAEAILKLKKVFGWGGDDDDDDDDDAEDTRPWWERALDKLGGKFGDKLLAKFTDMEDKGQTVDRETFMKEMSGYADQIAAEAAERQRQGLPAPAKPPALPAPPPAAPVQQLPPPPPAGAAPAAQLPPPPPPAPQAPQLQQPLTIEQEITIRVGTVLDMLDREATFRANEYHWNYEGCWMALPDDILEKVCAAADAVGVIDALTTPLLTPEKIAELKTKLTSNPKTAAWFMIGLNELKEWYAEKQKDPTFDPFADDGEEEGTEE